MNTRKLLSMLMVSLGAFSLVLTGCDNKKDSSSPSTEPSVPSSVTPSNPSSTTPSEDPSTPSSTVTDSSTSTPTVTDSSTETDSTGSSDVEIIPDATTYDVTFNYDEPKEALTVWTDYAIDRTEAPYNENKAHLDDAVDRRTVPLTPNPDSSTIEGQAGMYYFAVDADGYLVYASYGTGAGYGSPCDDYYHNQVSGKDYFSAPYWSLHEEYAPWSTNPKKVVIDGVTYDDYQLFDFVIPEGGFVVKGYYKEATMKDFWKQLTGQNNVPLGSLASVGGENNATLVGKIGTDDLEKLYFSIIEDENGTRKLSVRERTASEKIDDDGDQLTDTPSKMFTSTDADNPIVYTPIEDVAALADDSLVENVKGVISFKSGSNVIIVDENGDSILLYSSELADYVVGDTITVNGTKTTYNGDIEIKSITSHTKIAKYGKLTPVDAIEMTEENVDEVWVADNNYKTILIKHAQVVSIVAGGTSKLMLGETEIALYRATFPETISEGDYVDVLVAMMNYNTTIQGQVMSENDFARYYNISVDVDGVDGILEPEIFGKADGETFEVSAENDDMNYTFSHWEKYDPETDTWVLVTTDADLTITVEAADAQYRAVYVYSAWTNLPANMGQRDTITVTATTVTKSDVTVITDTTVGIRGTWLSPYDVQWNTIIAVDADGKIAYLVYNPANGYGGPSGAGYYTHPEYAAGDYHDNPALTILDGYGPWEKDKDYHTRFEVHAPEGGYLVTLSYNSAVKVITALTDGKVDYLLSEKDKETGKEANIGIVNNRNLAIDPTTRMFYDKGAGVLRVFVPSALEEHYLATMNQPGHLTSTGIGVFTDDDSNTMLSTKVEGRHTFDLGEKQFVVAVDANGKVIYGSYALNDGYGGPSDNFYASGFGAVASESQGQVVGDFFALGDNYGSWGECQTNKELSFSNYEWLVPTDGFVLVGSASNRNFKYMIGEIFGRNLQDTTHDTFNLGLAKGALDEVVVRLVDNNGVKQIKVENGKAVYADPTLVADDILDMTDAEDATHDLFDSIAIVDGKITVTGTTKPTAAHMIGTANVAYVANITDVDGGYTIASAMTDMTSQFYVVLDFVVDGTTYKLVAFHGAGEGTTFVTNADEVNQVGKSVVIDAVNNTYDMSLVWDGIQNLYTGTLTIPKWQNFSINYTDDDDQVISVWYDTCTITGDVVDTAKVGDQWNGGWFIDSNDCVAAHQWMHSNDGTVSYAITFDPATMTLTVRKLA